MFINTYKKYLLNKLLKKYILVSFIFFILILIINFIEEANFLKESNTTFYMPILLTFLNAPSLLLEIFPFIFLISTQVFLLDLFENQEFLTLKQFGISNLQLMKFISFVTIIISIVLILFFYNFSSIVKNEYLKIKNNFTNDNKYLAVITKNGLWIKDSQLNGEILIVNAKQIQNHYLIGSSITRFDKNYEIIENIIADKVDVKNNNWKLLNATKTEEENITKKYEEYFISTQFNIEKINNLFSDLSSLTFFGLLQLERNYKSIGFSVDDINLKKNKYFSSIFFMFIMSIIGALLVLKTNLRKNYFINIFISIFLSIIIYYIVNFFNLLGKNGHISITLSVWFPIIVLIIVSIIPMIKIDEI